MKKPVMVIGGGIAGICAALDLAGMDIPVHLVESSPTLGGRMAQLDKTFPTNDCSACILAPKMTECFNHPMVKTYTLTELTEVKGEAPDFTAVLRVKPRYVDEDLCKGCGDCFAKCPAEAADEFNMGLSGRKAIYKPFAQAVPNKAVIDMEACRKCRLCEKACKAEAIRLSQTEQTVELPVSAVILATGYDAVRDIPAEYGYGQYPNVVTSLEYERMMCASGPFGGHIKRPSDGAKPRRIAFLQCVGSRDHRCGADYCSSICCMQAVKGAIITKEHDPSVEIDIFYMDMRAQGKGFGAYVESACERYGIGFIRSRAAGVQPVGVSDRLNVQAAEGSGEYDLVVLSVGLRAKPLPKLGVKLDRYGFVWSHEFGGGKTARDGIFTCGAASAPKDIPETVTEASAAAVAAARFAGLREVADVFSAPILPKVRDVSKEPVRIGVFVCHCGLNIAGFADISEIAEYAEGLPFVAHVEQSVYACAMDAQQIIAERIHEMGLNRIVVAACTPRTHEGLFRSALSAAGLNPYLLAMANIRDQCTWVHMEDKAAATFKAKELVRMAVGKVTFARQLGRKKIGVTKAALVIGGGAAGLTAAAELAGLGHEVHLVEKSDKLGGNALRLATSAQGRPVQPYIERLIAKVPNVHLNAEIESIDGYVGNFTTTTSQGVTIKHGVIIVATGATEILPREREISQMQLENHPLNGIKHVAMVQCTGERGYCSRVCCNQAIKNALLLRERGIAVTILHREIRSYGMSELKYREARRAGVTFIRFENEPEIPKSADLIVRASEIKPAENLPLAQMLKVPLTADGFFMEAHAKLRPVDFATEGIYVCGLAHAPKNMPESIMQARAAAGRAATVIAKSELETEGEIAAVRRDYCAACGECEKVCPYKAIEIEETAKINDVLCKGCGTCAATCRPGAIDIGGFSDRQIIAEIEYLLRSGDAPRIVAFLCNWCSYAGADMAGTGRLQYPPNIRVIRVPCSGRMNPGYIIKALTEGAERVLVSGCHPGDCHYISGNIFAKQRFSAMERLLKLAGFEPDRVRFTWISAAEGAKFAETVKEISDGL